MNTMTDPTAHSAAAELADLLAEPIAYSATAGELMTALTRVVADIPDFAAVPNGENRGLLAAALRAHGHDAREVARAAISAARNPDDLLRAVLACYTEPIRADVSERYGRAVRHLSDRDSGAVRMDSMPTSVRRALGARLGRLTDGFRADRLVNRTRLWRLVARYAHLYDYARRDDSLRRALDIIHGNVEYRTHASLVESALSDGDATEALALLAHNPPQLYRRINALLSAGAVGADVSHAVLAVGASVPLTTAISTYNGLLGLTTGRGRVLRVAGRANHMRDAAQVDVLAVSEVLAAMRAAMVERMAARLSEFGTGAGPEPVGTCGPQPVALVRRDGARADRVLDRGQRVALAGHGDTVRLFVHWNNDARTGRRIDLDLGAMVLDDSGAFVTAVDYRTYGGARSYATFSGDLTSAPAPLGAAEFIDLNLPVLRAELPQARWVVATVVAYTGDRLVGVDHLAGAMLRSDADAGAAFDPRTVVSAATATTSATRSALLAVDVRTGELVWLDTDDGAAYAGYAASMGGALAQAAAFELNAPRMSAGELAGLYATACGLDTDPGAPVDPALIDRIVGA